MSRGVAIFLCSAAVVGVSTLYALSQGIGTGTIGPSNPLNSAIGIGTVGPVTPYYASSGPPPSCAGVVDLSVGCALPMMGGSP